MLTTADHRHMAEQGYLVIHDAVPPQDLAAVVDGIWGHMGMNRDDPDSWYGDPHGDSLQKHGFMRQMHSPALIWDVFTPHGHCRNTSSKPRLAQFLTMWPATEEGHGTGLRVFWPSSLPSNDGSALGEKCGGLAAERRSRIAQWREGLQTDYGRPEPERIAGQDDVPSCPLSPLGRRLLGLDPWPAA